MMLRLLVTALLIVPLPARADPLSPVKTAELSARLFATGVETGDPLLMLAAARLRKTIAPRRGDRAAEGGESAPEAPLGWQDMLAAATDLAQGDDAMLGLIGDVAAETSKGVSDGPVYNTGRLRTGGRDTYPPIAFVGGAYAEVYVEAKSATNLNLTITDAKGRLVCSDTDVSHIAYCGWTPDAGGAFTLRVENKGPAGAAYALMTN